MAPHTGPETITLGNWDWPHIDVIYFDLPLAHESFSFPYNTITRAQYVKTLEKTPN